MEFSISDLILKAQNRAVDQNFWLCSPFTYLNHVSNSIFSGKKKLRLDTTGLPNYLER